MLKSRNHHKNDSCITFDEEPHIYYVDGIPVKTSVTAFLSQYTSKFDATKSSKEQYEKYYNTVGHKYHQMTAEEIQKLWKDKNLEATTSGNKLHKAIEQYYNDDHSSIDVETMETIEWKYFQNFIQNNQYLIPYRTEWEIYDRKLQLAGSIDIIFKNSDGTFDLGDWKRSKEIKMVNPPYFKNSHFSLPLSHLHDTNYWKYALQLNMYKYILETNYDVKIKNLHLYVFHGNNKNYLHFDIPCLKEEILSIVNERLEVVNNT